MDNSPVVGKPSVTGLRKELTRDSSGDPEKWLEKIASAREKRCSSKTWAMKVNVAPCAVALQPSFLLHEKARRSDSSLYSPGVGPILTPTARLP